MDQSEYNQLVQETQKTGCEIVVSAPRVNEMKLHPVENRVQLQYVDMKMMRALRPVLTPQTFLLDRTARIKWSCLGSVDIHALRLALRALKNINN